MTFRFPIIAILGAASLAVPAHAATIDIIGTIGNGALTGTQGSGTITFDETLLTNFGTEVLAPVGSTTAAIEDATLAISFTIGGTTFNEANDVDFPDFPALLFTDGDLSFVNYVLVDGVNDVDLAPFGLIDAFFSDDLAFDATLNAYTVGIEVEYALSQVPLPAGLPLLAVGLGAFGLAKRRAAHKANA